MKDTFNNIVIYNGYPLSVVIAVTFHSAILALLLYLQNSKSPEALELIQPTVVKALLVNENPQLANKRKRLERQQQQQRTREREAAQKAAADARAEQQRKKQAAADAKKTEEQRKARELASLRQRQEQERLDTEQLSREHQERKEREEQQRRQRQQEIRDRELDRQRQQEAADAAAAEVASSEFEMVQSGTSIIQQAVQSVWSRPPSARNGMRAILQIRMLPTGEIVDVSVTESSGDPAFDRSAENAVYNVAPFSELQALPIQVFNENFRSLSLIFQPEDLLN